jgi:hypothetical protein
MANKNTPSEPNYASTPDAPTTPYDFFMAPKQAASGRPLPVGGKLLGTRPGAEGGSNTKRIVFFAAGGAIAIIGVIMAIIAFSPKDPAGVQLFDIAQTQQELIRVCGLGTINGKSQTTRNFSVTCSTGITGDQTTLLAYMKKTGVDYDPKLLAAKKSAQIDAKLAQASSSSTYDSTYDTVVEAQLATYNRALTSQLGTTTSATGRAVLTKSQKDAELLVKMLNGSN